MPESRQEILSLLLLEERDDEMGTSKGYIAPSTPNWRQAKREVSRYLSNPTESERKTVTAQYAKAMTTGGYNATHVAKAFAGVIDFSTTSASRGYAAALHDIAHDDIISLEPQEAMDALISIFASDGSTIDDKIALDSIAESFQVLEVIEPEDLQNVDTSHLLKEMICQFAKLKFAQLFDKQIRNKCPIVEEANSRIAEMQDYVYYTMGQQLTDDALNAMNPHNLANEAVVQYILEESFKLMTIFYGE